MKLIIAAVRSNMKDDIVHALHKLDSFPGALMSQVEGVGLGRHHKSLADPVDTGLGPPAYVRLEIVCRDDHADEIVQAIKNKAYTGNPGDGRVFVMDAENAIRIRTGQQGEDAL
jgi:nitrogen regulatory protein PII